MDEKDTLERKTATNYLVDAIGIKDFSASVPPVGGQAKETK